MVLEVAVAARPEVAVAQEVEEAQEVAPVRAEPHLLDFPTPCNFLRSQHPLPKRPELEEVAAESVAASPQMASSSSA